MDIHFTIRQIEIFYYSVKFLSITQAADKLCIATPAAWKHIKNLEAQCGEVLLFRSGNQLVLTSAGAFLFCEVEKLLSACNKFSLQINQVLRNNNQPIKLSVTNTFQYPVFVLLKGFMEKNNSLEIEVSLDGWVEQAELMQSNNPYDFVIMNNPPFENIMLPQVTILSSHYVVVVDRDHPLTSRQKVESLDLAPYPYIATRSNSIAQQQQDVFFDACQMKTRAFYVDSFLAAKDAVKANVGIALLPFCLVEDELKNGSLIQLALDANIRSAQLVLMYKNKELHSGSHQLFFDYFSNRRILADHDKG